MIQLVLLAAGSSKRFGADKLMWELDGKPMIMHTIEKLLALQEMRGWQVTLVTKAGAVQELASELPLNIVLNHDPDRGISSSLKCALDSFDGSVKAAVFFVADQPGLKADTISEFIDAYRRSGKMCGCLAYKGETGNPCGFSSKLFSELAELTGDKGGKKVLMRHLDSCYMHEIDDPVQLSDIDTHP